MKYLAGVAAALLLLIRGAAAASDFPRVPPTEPERAEATFEVLHGFRMELIAAEPLVASPVDVAYDEDGRAYVVEMRDYPYPEEKNAEPKEFPGTVRLVEDTDGDGRFDKATIFADQLAWPTSACCWKGGVFVAAAPDIWYFKDTDGDRRADIRRKVFTGFGRYNVQAIMNNLRWGLDNKIYGAAAGNGGKVVGTLRVPSDASGTPSVPTTIDLARRDFRFDPVTETLEAISGGERFGNTFDDWGNRFVCNIRNPVQHVVLEQRYLARNPHFVPGAVIHDCAESGDQLRVFRASPPEPWRVFRAQRWALEGQAMPRSELIGAGYWTSSSGVTVYRGGAYPPEFRGNVFIGEVAGNLVHRQILARDGVTFKSRRADESTEFIRSRDNWFRPVNFANAPDGTLHVVDMYRETIEHPWSIPDDIKARLDLTSGKERGRIYRVTSPGFASSKQPKLSLATTAELVAHLESPHSWWRETAQRLLVERQDKAAVPPLRALVHQRENPLARLHALCALAGLESLSADDLRWGMSDDSDTHANVVRHAILLAEQFHPKVLDEQALIILNQHADKQVRFQTALALGSIDERVATRPWMQIAERDADDPWMRAALLASGADRSNIGGAPSREEFDKLPPALRQGRSELARQVALLVGLKSDGARAAELLASITDEDGPYPDDFVFAVLSGLGEGLSRRKVTLNEFVRGRPESEPVKKRALQAALIATDSQARTGQRIAALELLRVFGWNEAQPALDRCLAPTEARDLQHAALRLAGTFAERAASDLIIARRAQLGPSLRDEVVGILLSRSIWHEALVEALESGTIPPAQISIPHRARLTSLADKGLAERAKNALAAVALGPRKEIIEKYLSALSMKADAVRGAVVYRRECANCHKLGGEGHEVGPNLATIVHRSPQEILIHVLDPNREVSPQFLDYAVRLTDGRVLTGMIAAETDAGLTLRRAENREDTVIRSEIGEISSSGKSLMPEGLEQKISAQEMADLIGFLRAPIEHNK
jgi:putative membrane-bound dehydrogenase-like protein